MKATNDTPWLDSYKDDYVCSRMIYRDALGRDSDNPKQWELQEIGNIMNNSIDGWEKGRNIDLLITVSKGAGKGRSLGMSSFRYRMMWRCLLNKKVF